MANTGFVLGQTATQQYVDGYWNDVDNILTDDSDSAYNEIVTGETPNTGHLIARNFPWDFEGDPIGIEVQARVKAPAHASFSAIVARLNQDGTVIDLGDSDGASLGLRYMYDTSTYLFTWGGPTNMMGLGEGGLTNEEAHESTFGVGFIGSLFNDSAIHVEAVWMKIYHPESEESVVTGTAELTLPGLGAKAHKQLN